MANYPGKISEQFFKPYAELLSHFPQIVSKLGWLHEHKYLPNTRKIFYHKATCTQLTCHRYDSSSLIACFVAESCANINLPIPTVTFDQLLCIKTYEIVSTKNMKISVWLCGFHQLMSFLGLIGCLIEASGLQTALECVYAKKLWLFLHFVLASWS